jgi:hypothetical protein
MESKTKILIAAATCVILAICLVLFFVLRSGNTDETNSGTDETGTDETNTVQNCAQQEAKVDLKVNNHEFATYSTNLFPAHQVAGVHNQNQPNQPYVRCPTSYELANDTKTEIKITKDIQPCGTGKRFVYAENGNTNECVNAAQDNYTPTCMGDYGVLGQPSDSSSERVPWYEGNLPKDMVVYAPVAAECFNVAKNSCGPYEYQNTTRFDLPSLVNHLNLGNTVTYESGEPVGGLHTDDYGAHVQPDGQVDGLYHYHAPVAWDFDSDTPYKNKIIGYAYDGHAIVGYGSEQCTNVYCDAVYDSATSSYQIISMQEVNMYHTSYEYVPNLGTLDEFNMGFFKFIINGQDVVKKAYFSTGDQCPYITIHLKGAMPSYITNHDLLRERPHGHHRTSHGSAHGHA